MEPTTPTPPPAQPPVGAPEQPKPTEQSVDAAPTDVVAAPAPTEDEAASKQPETSPEPIAKAPKTPLDKSVKMAIVITVFAVTLLAALAILAFLSGQK